MYWNVLKAKGRIFSAVFCSVHFLRLTLDRFGHLITMKINPLLFDQKGRMQLGSGYPTDIKWHPLYAEDELYRFIAASYSTGEVKLFHVEVDSDGVPKGLSVDHAFTPDKPLACNCLDWSTNGQFIVAGYSDKKLRLFDIFKNQQVKEKDFDGKGNIGDVIFLKFSPDGKYILSGSANNSGTLLLLSETRSGKPVPGFKGKGHNLSLNSFNFSPCGKYFVSASPYNSFGLWEMQSGKVVCFFDCDDLSGNINSPFCSPNGENVFAEVNEVIYRWDARTGKRCSDFKIEINLNCVSYSPSGQFIFCYHGPKANYLSNGGVESIVIIERMAENCHPFIFDIKNGEAKGSFNENGHTRPLHCASFSPDSRFIVFASQDRKIIIWSTNEKRPIADFENSFICDYDGTTSFSPDGNAIVYGPCNDCQKFIDLETLKSANISLGCQKDTYYYSCLSPSGGKIAFFSKENNLLLRNFGDIKPINKSDGKPFVDCMARKMSFSPDERKIVFIMRRDEKFAMLNLKGHKLVSDFVVNGLGGAIFSIQFSPCGNKIATGTKYGEIRIWNIKKKEVINNCHVMTDQVHSVAFSPDGKYIVSGGADSKVRIWQLKSEILNLSSEGKKQNRMIDSVDFQPTGKLVVSGDWENKIYLYDSKTGKTIDTLDGLGHNKIVSTASFSPNGRYILSKSNSAGGNDTDLLLWSLERILGPTWLKEHLATPLILTGVWFPDDTLEYLQETKQGTIVPNRPLARCGECGLFFPVEDNMLGKDVGCPNKVGKNKRCHRLVKLNEFTAGEER